MKLNINIPKHTELIAKYLAGEMTAREAEDFEGLISKYQENELLINEMKNDWKLIGGESVKKPNVDEAWNKMHSKLESENLIEKDISIPIYRMQWAQAAAAVLVLFVVSSVFLFSGIWSREIIVQTTSDPATLVQTLADGSNVYLKPNTKITYNKNFGKKNRKITLSGEAFFEVASNANLPFEITTNDAMVKVLGTSFTVKSIIESDFEVIVESGSVNISSKADKKQSLVAIAGDRVTLANNNLTKTSNLNASFKEWKTQRLQFKDETIANIIQIINKNYNSNIILDSPGIENRRITVTFYNNTISSIVEVVSAALGLEAQYIDNTIILRNPNNDDR
jgi:ferric-dicitrate binding protein FerR (iron transport regulator)